MTGTVLLLHILLSAISDCAFTLAVGLMLVSFLTAPTNITAAPRSTGLLSAIAIMLLAQLPRPWFLAASMSGSSSFSENFALIPSIISSTLQGTLWKLNIVAMFALIAIIVRTHRRNRITIYAPAICLCIVAFVKAASSHAADDGAFSLLEINQFIHILATAVWAGIIIVAGLITLPALTRTSSSETIWQFLQHISTTATYAIIVILATGIYTGDRELAGPLTTLPSSTWGKILIAKIAVVLLALALGASNRFRCLAKDISPERIALSSRLLRIEAVAMLVILSLSGWLGNTSPVMQ